MQPAGIAEVELAKADGRLGRRIRLGCQREGSGRSRQGAREVGEGKKFFDLLSSTNRYSILYRLQAAKRPDTRARRLEKFIEMLNSSSSAPTGNA